MPEPVSDTRVGDRKELCETSRLAVKVPIACGANTTVTVQAPAGSVPAQVFVLAASIVKGCRPG